MGSKYEVDDLGWKRGVESLLPTSSYNYICTKYSPQYNQNGGGALTTWDVYSIGNISLKSLSEHVLMDPTLAA